MCIRDRYLGDNMASPTDNCIILGYDRADNRGYLTVGGDGDNVFTITNGGAIGINNTAPVEKLGISGNMRFINPNDNTSRITALPSGTYTVGNSGGSAIAFHRVADGGGGSDEIAFETHWQGNFHGERLRIEKNGDLKVNGGDLYFATAGRGIVLGATSNTDANTLDDYEEGSWTPAWSLGSGSMSTLNASGTYIKIGRVVYIMWGISTNGGSSPSGTIKITGIPFSAQTPNSQSFRGGFGSVNAGYNCPKALQYAVASGTTINLLTDDHTALQTTDSGFGYGYNECQINGSLVYNVA